MSERSTPDWRWVVALIPLVIVTAIAVVLNLNTANNQKNTSTAIDIDNGDTKINWDNYESYDVELSSDYNITAPGIYHLTGTISDGGISIRLVDNGVIKLILDNVSIKNSDGPAIACYSGDDLVIELVGENYLEDGSKYNSSYDEDVSGAIYSKADLTFIGDGDMTLKANYQDGIVSKDDLKINGGTYNITAKDDGIRGKDSVYVASGEIEISAGGDGIKSTNETELSKGFVLIADGSIDITKSYEGLEARRIIIDGGEVSIFSNDDGMNAGGGDSTMMETNESCSIAINGGEVYVNAAGDGLDSNGYLYINGGSVIIDGPTNSGNGALDAGASIIMNGGTVMAVGASGMAESLGLESTVYNLSVFFGSTLSSGTKIEIKDSAGKTILTHTPAKTFSHLAAGSTDFKKDETYTIYLNGVEHAAFTISDITTVVGNNTSMGPGGGNPGGVPGEVPGGNPGETGNGTAPRQRR